MRPCFAAVQHEVACSRPSDFRRALSHPPHCNTPAPSTTPVDLGPLHHLGACHLVWLGRRAPRCVCDLERPGFIHGPSHLVARQSWPAERRALPNTAFLLCTLLAFCRQCVVLLTKTANPRRC